MNKSRYKNKMITYNQKLSKIVVVKIFKKSFFKKELKNIIYSK